MPGREERIKRTKATVVLMAEKGVVTDVKDNGKIAVVSMKRTEACAKCKACFAGFSESTMLLEVKNAYSAKIGDSVLIELPDKGFFAASMIMYLFPLAAALAGFFAGGAVSDILGFALGVLLLLVSYLIIRANEGKLKRLPLFSPFIAGVIPSSLPTSSEVSEPLK